MWNFPPAFEWWGPGQIQLPGWGFHRQEGEYRVYRLYQGLGVAEHHIGGGLLLVFDRRGVKEWDGRVLRKWVEVSRAGLKMGADQPVLWY